MGVLPRKVPFLFFDQLFEVCFFRSPTSASGKKHRTPTSTTYKNTLQKVDRKKETENCSRMVLFFEFSWCFCRILWICVGLSPFFSIFCEFVLFFLQFFWIFIELCWFPWIKKIQFRCLINFFKCVFVEIQIKSKKCKQSIKNSQNIEKKWK